MKRITLILTILAVSIVTGAFSQSKMHEKSREEVRQYFENNIFPKIEKEQLEYLKNLSEDEDALLTSVKENIAEQRGNCNGEPGKKGRGVNDNKNFNRRGGKQGVMRIEVQDDIRKITDLHPKLNSSYSSFIEKNKVKWIADIKAINDKSAVDTRCDTRGNTGIDEFFTTASSPEWLLLWDLSNTRQARNIKNRSQQNTKRINQKNGKNDISPELRAEVRSFTIENIIPVISTERINFDGLLTDNEKAVIEITRQKIQVRKVMFVNWRDSEDFEPGARAKDPNFDGMRTDMRNSMSEVREIAIAHKTEIRESSNKITSHMDEWETGLTKIAENNNQDPQVVLGIINHQMQKSRAPISFLLFNPDEANKTTLFDINQDNQIKVIVYPNPIAQKGVIAIIGANEKDIQVTLFSKDGKNLSTLYSGLNMEERLEIEIDASKLGNDVFLIKVIAGESEIARKFIVNN